jgi:hypothetical protein
MKWRTTTYKRATFNLLKNCSTVLHVYSEYYVTILTRALSPILTSTYAIIIFKTLLHEGGKLATCTIMYVYVYTCTTYQVLLLARLVAATDLVLQITVP